MIMYHSGLHGIGAHAWELLLKRYPEFNLMLTGADVGGVRHGSFSVCWNSEAVMIIYFSGIERPVSWEMVKRAQCQDVMTSYVQLRGDECAFLQLLLKEMTKGDANERQTPLQSVGDVPQPEARKEVRQRNRLS